MKSIFSNNENNIAGCPKTVIALFLSSLLVGCSSDDDSDNSGANHDEHSDIHVETKGRLALLDSAENAVKIIDIDSAEMLQVFPLSGEAPRLYSSPDYRYVAAVQRSDNTVSFVDSGLFTEDHGDHLHDYTEIPSILGFTLGEVKPTHFTVSGEYAVVFNDGGDGVTSSVSVITDTSIGEGVPVASLELTNNMHGVGEIIGDKLFVTYRDSSIIDTTLPAEVERYHFDGDNFVFETRYTEQCPLLHGAGSNEDYVVFGCGDGVLAISLNASNYPATKLDNPESITGDNRIGSIYSHHNVRDLVGTARGHDQLFIIDPASNTPFSELAMPNGAQRVTQGFDVGGENFYILTNDGSLHLYDPVDNWRLTATINVMDALAEDDVTPVVTSSVSENRLFVLIPSSKNVVEIDLDAGTNLGSMNIGFDASRMVWLGLLVHDKSNH